MKLHSISHNKHRELKDFPDIVQLIVMNTIDPNNKDIKKMFDKYKCMKLYKKVIKAVGERIEKER